MIGTIEGASSSVSRQPSDELEKYSKKTNKKFISNYFNNLGLSIIDCLSLELSSND